MPRHCSNSLAFAEYLENHPVVRWLKYLRLKSFLSYKMAKQYLKNGLSGVVFRIKSRLVAGKKFIESTRLISHVANLGDAKTPALYLESPTHFQLSLKGLEDCGVTQYMIRISVGPEDIIADIDQTLEVAIKGSLLFFLIVLNANDIKILLSLNVNFYLVIKL